MYVTDSQDSLGSVRVLQVYRRSRLTTSINSTHPMKIAYLGSKGLPSKSGTERVLEAIVLRLASQHELTIYCDSQYTPSNYHVPGVRLIRIPSIPGKHLRATVLFLLSAIHALLFGRYDLK